MTELALISKWSALHNQGCPYLISRGPNKGRPCGKDSFGGIRWSFKDYNPMCGQHLEKWEHHPDHMNYLQDLRILQLEREQDRQEEENQLNKIVERLRTKVSSAATEEERKAGEQVVERVTNELRKLQELKQLMG